MVKAPPQAAPGAADRLPPGLAGEADLFRWLLAPLTPEEFERTYYQKRVAVVPRGAPDYHDGLLSLADLDYVLGTHAARHPDINIVQAGRDFAVSEFTDGDRVVDPVRAARLFAEGATIVFTQLHGRLPALARLCTMLGRLFSSRMQTNIYLTPARSQGFAAHWDTHDVFVLQVLGSKRWTIYDTPIPLPLHGQEFDPARHAPKEPTLEFELRPGDMAYVPRGAFHAARSTDELSLHITAGLIAFTWADLFLNGVTAAAETDEALRENLPFGFESPTFPAEEKSRLLREKLARVGAHIEANPPYAYFAGQVLARNRPVLTNLLSQATAASRLSLASRVRCRPDLPWQYQTSDETCRIRAHGNHIDMPGFLAPALDFILKSPQFRIGEIPDCVDAEGKVTLVRRLIKEAILECLEP